MADIFVQPQLIAKIMGHWMRWIGGTLRRWKYSKVIDGDTKGFNAGEAVSTSLYLVREAIRLARLGSDHR